MRRVSKPFENVDRDPTISPYIHLDRDDDEKQIVPNYFTFVRPQLEQMATNRFQQREIQQLRGQVQGMTMSGIAPQGVRTVCRARVRRRGSWTPRSSTAAGGSKLLRVPTIVGGDSVADFAIQWNLHRDVNRIRRRSRLPQSSRYKLATSFDDRRYRR